MRITSRVVLLSAALMAAAIPLSVQATPYASSVTNVAGTVSFYVNENGGNVVVVYEDGSTNASFNGINAGTNVTAGRYSFSLGGHTTYSITVTKTGAGTAALVSNPIQNTNVFAAHGNGLFINGNMRGVAVNMNATSPYFGRIYLARSAAPLLWDFNSDGSFAAGGPGSAGGTAGVSWQTSSTSSPYRMSVGPDGFVMVSDFSTAGSTIYRIDPNLTTNQIFLGPTSVGVANGYVAGIHGSEESQPLVIGDLNVGATLLVVDGDLGDTGTSQIGSSSATQSNDNALMVYSNLTYSTLPWQSAPSYWGPSVGLPMYSGEYLGPAIGISVCGNGYVYCSV
jgi:hypothetical protein